MDERRIITMILFAMGLCMIFIVSSLPPTVSTEVNESADSISYYKIVAQTYKEYYEKSILDPAVRIKLIMGMPEDSAITWVRKCHYNINSKALLKWRPDGKP